MSGLPPIYVRGNVGDYGGFGGISTRGGHMIARSDCLNDMMRLFSHHTSPPSSSYFSSWSFGAAFGGFESDVSDGGGLLPTSTFVVGAASSWRANQPATWLEYVASDLPVPIALQIAGLLLAAAAVAHAAWAILRWAHRWAAASASTKQANHTACFVRSQNVRQLWSKRRR